jgi:hypothetical protein
MMMNVPPGAFGVMIDVRRVCQDLGTDRLVDPTKHITYHITSMLQLVDDPVGLSGDCHDSAAPWQSRPGANLATIKCGRCR